MTSRTERIDFQATSDPALLAASDRGESHLLTYRAAVRAVGAPAVGDAGARLHPRPRGLARALRRRGALPAHVRAVGVLRRRAARGGGARADDARGARRGDAASSCARRSPTRRATWRSSTASTPRSACSSPSELEGRLEETSAHLNPSSASCSTSMLRRRVDRLAVEPEDLETLVEAVTIYHMVIEGMLALTGQHFIMDYNERMGTLPGVREGLHAGGARRAPPRRVRRALPARHGPAATRATRRRSSARWPRSRRSPTACCGRSGSTAPTTSRCCSASRSTRRARSRCKALERRMKVIGLVAAA